MYSAPFAVTPAILERADVSPAVEEGVGAGVRN
jgi:hypothetical protein